MKDTGSALMGIGIGSGENRAVDAAKAAISSPLLELSIDGARGILFTVTGGKDLAMSEVEDAAKIITSSAAEDAKVIFGAIIDETLTGGVKITVIATGFDDRRPVSEEENLARYSPFGTVSLPSKFKQREEETQDKRFFSDLASTKKNTSRAPAQPEHSTRETKTDASAQNQPGTQNAGTASVSDDDLEIPAFIRRKMGV
jgi:cell division GTPase FtsZ